MDIPSDFNFDWQLIGKILDTFYCETFVPYNHTWGTRPCSGNLRTLNLEQHLMLPYAILKSNNFRVGQAFRGKGQVVLWTDWCLLSPALLTSGFLCVKTRCKTNSGGLQSLLSQEQRQEEEEKSTQRLVAEFPWLLREVREIDLLNIFFENLSLDE